MLKGISPVISPGLLKILCEMGHGDEIVLADSNFPGVSVGKRVVRADGLTIKTILEADPSTLCVGPLCRSTHHDASGFGRSTRSRCGDRLYAGCATLSA